MRASRRGPWAVGVLLLGAPAVLAAQGHSFSVERYLDLERVSSPQISPDGSRIVYTRSYVDPTKDTFASMLWQMDADGSRQRQLVKGSSAQWSADGSRIAYLADADGKTQLWVRYMDAEGSAIQVTRGDEAPEAFKWSPDGRWLAFTMFVPQVNNWAISLPTPAGAKWTGAPRIVDRLIYRADRVGPLRDGFTRLFVVPAEGGAPRQATPSAFDVGPRAVGIPGGAGIEWLADGKTIIVDGNADTNAELQFRTSNLYGVDVATGAMKRLTTDAGFWHTPILSPDGKWLAYIGTAKTTKTYRAEDLFIMHPDGSGVRMVTPNFDRDPASVAWASDNETLWFTAEDHGSVNTFTASLNVKTPGVHPASNGIQVLALGSISSKSGYGVATRTSPREPVEIVRFPLKKAWDMQQLTHVNQPFLTGLDLGEIEELNFTSSGGAKVQGWVIKPPSFDPAKKYPLILEIHGGPHAMYNVAFNPSLQNFAANGFLTLYLNPRGSTGYGTDFGNAIEKAYPGVDYDDLMAGVNETINRGWVDSTRMFVGGCTGGGVLSSWIIGHTTRFAAAAVRCPVINWLSFAGETDIPLFDMDLFAKPYWEDPTEWLKLSPIMYVGNVKTPTLLMTGELDMRTPMPQSEEFYAALKMRGIPTKLLRFQGEYHGTASKPSNWMRTQLYMMNWYSSYGPAKP